MRYEYYVRFIFLEKILSHPIVNKRIEKLFPGVDFISPEKNELLRTIRIPNNLIYLTEHLPKSNYQNGKHRKRGSSAEGAREDLKLEEKLPNLEKNQYKSRSKPRMEKKHESSEAKLDKKGKRMELDMVIDIPEEDEDEKDGKKMAIGTKKKSIAVQKKNSIIYIFCHFF